ncbi:hypothetical protein CHLRE_13g583217v5 [Chlamydomonas reinhardtii]|uniref:N-acetyltransferase domain-containing protein n=1 Tax=Chlamydomonas reinhardtii TaxID=3055 RepID=A0A2K3D0J5_CHLRE|nr:uncharacterized protein CHLRE_13g583217v5 [Chlamydomonas reinhardtii]PNW74047.1 hypothetical protein CHLRE_13g583217v5 [Chlamydomonas reinhardtii]
MAPFRTTRQICVAERAASGAAACAPHLAAARGPLRRPSLASHPPSCATSPGNSTSSISSSSRGQAPRSSTEWSEGAAAPGRRAGATPAVRIRQATPDDSVALAALDASCAADGSSGWSEGIYRTDLQPGSPNLILLAEADDATGSSDRSSSYSSSGNDSSSGSSGRLLALAAGSQAGGEVSLTNVAVAAACRGAGLGRRITVELLRRLGSGQGPTFLEVRVDNAAAQALYARLGFEVAGRRKRYNPDGSDSFVMIRQPGPLS